MVSRTPSRGSFVVIEETTEPRTSANAAALSFPASGTRDQCVVNPLVIPLAMVMRDVIRDRSSQIPLADRNQPIEALFVDGSYEAFGIGIRIRRPIGRQHDADPRLAQPRVYRRTPLCIAPGPIATFMGWKDKGRYVRKGERAITLCRPITVKRPTTADDGTEGTNVATWFVYKAYWFVLAQTDGQDIEPLTIPRSTLQRWLAQKPGEIDR